VISPSGNVSVSHGNSQTFSIFPDGDYEINQVSVDGVNNSTATGAGTYTFSNVTANHTITVSFKQKPQCLDNLVVQVWDDAFSVVNDPAKNGG